MQKKIYERGVTQRRRKGNSRERKYHEQRQRGRKGHILYRNKKKLHVHIMKAIRTHLRKKGART